MKCEVCGVELKDADKFCGICGTPNPNFVSDNRAEIFESTVKSVSDGEIADVSVNADIESPTAEGLSETGAEAEAIPHSGKAADTAAEEYCGSRNADVTAEAPALTGMPKLAESENVGGQAEENKVASAESAGAAAAPSVVSDTVCPRQKEARYVGGFVPPPYDPRQGGNYTENNSLPKEKEKRVCSLSAVVFCIVVILILSVACGVLGGMYLNERSRRVRTGYDRSGTAYGCYGTFRTEQTEQTNN